MTHCFCVVYTAQTDKQFFKKLSKLNLSISTNSETLLSTRNLKVYDIIYNFTLAESIKLFLILFISIYLDKFLANKINL